MSGPNNILPRRSRGDMSHLPPEVLRAQFAAESAAAAAEGPPIPADAPTITIDGILVTLLYRSTYEGYTLVLYRSGEDLTFAYLSKSEGLWRLFFRVDPTTFLNPNTRSAIMMKGHNYVTTTQLHFRLQCFITEHIARLPRLGDPMIYRDLFYTKPGTPRGDRLASAIGYVNPFRRLVPEFPLASLKPVRAREFVHPVFEPLTIACDETCFKDTFDKIYSKFSLLRRTGYLVQSDYLKKLQQLFGIGIKGSLINTPAFRNESVISKEDRYKTLVAILSAYMSHFFTVSEAPSEYICTLPMDVQCRYRSQFGRETGYSEVMPVRVFRTTITLKTEALSFHLYYGTYTMQADSPHAGSYKIILNLLPSTSKLGEFGMNDAYISANVYVYKMFEYSGIQVNRAVSSVLYHGRYNFIGDLLTDMWPLKNVREAEVADAAAVASSSSSSATTSGGRRDRTRRTKKSQPRSRRSRIKRQ